MATEEETQTPRFVPTRLELKPANAVPASNTLLRRMHAYLSSFPGRETLSKNILLGSKIRHCRLGYASRETLEALSDALRYRERLGKITNKIRDIMGLRSFPDYEDWEYHEHFWEKHRVSDAHWYHDAFRGLRFFPKPTNFKEEGFDYNEGSETPKTMHYVACAMFEHELTRQEVSQKLMMVIDMLRDEEQWKSAIRRNDRPGMAAKPLHRDEFMEEGLEVGEWRWKCDVNVLMARELGDLSFRGSLRLLGGKSRQECSLQERRELIRQSLEEKTDPQSKANPLSKRAWWA